MKNAMLYKGSLSVLGCLMAAVAAQAEIETATWTDLGSRGNVVTRIVVPDGGSGSWWEGGSAPELVEPASTNLVVDFSATATEAKRLAEIAAGVTQKYYGPTILQFFNNNDNYDIGLYFDSIRGNVWTTWTARWASSARPVLLRDAAGFKGVFDVVDGVRSNHEQLYLYPDAGKTGTINRVIANGGWGVKVSTGSYGLVNEIIGAGTIDVNRDCASVGKWDGVYRTCPFPPATAGGVEIMNRPGPLTTLKIYDGAVTLHGHAATEPTAPAGEPALRLDASVSSSLTTSGEDASVTEWRDADGRTAYLAVPYDEGTCPRLMTDDVSGLKAVDFGGISGATGTNGIAQTTLFGRAGFLKLNAAIENVREIAVVFRDHFWNNGFSTNPQLIGYELAEWKRDWLRQNATLFYTGVFCEAPVAYGTTILNGQTTLPSAKPNTMLRMNVVSSSLSDGHLAKVSRIGGATWSSKWYGGAVIAEVIVYTNLLTAAEREQTHRYLMRKWCSDEKQWDFERLDFKKGNTITIADGVVSVRELNLPSGTTTFVKKGAGTLEIGSFPSTLTQIDIEAGDVAFAQSHEKDDDPQPATDATLHFDATRYAEDMMTYAAGGKTWVTNWYSYPRQNAGGHAYTMSRPAMPSGYTCTNYPSLRLNYPKAGLAMVDLGAYRTYEGSTKTIANDATSLCFFLDGTQERYDCRHREGFVVYVKTDEETTAIASQDWTITKLRAGKNDKLVNDTYTFNRVVSGYWTYEGAWCEPWSQKDSNDTPHVVGWRAASPQAVNSFFTDRGATYGPDGGGLLGEVIYYDRTLTPQERRDTELYLLRKWKDASAVHPRDAYLPSALPMLNYLDKRTSATIAVDSGSVVQSKAYVVEELEKTGEGAAVAFADAEALRNICIRAGELSLTECGVRDADFRVDATDVSSMTYTVDSSGVTNVTKWGEATALTSWTPRQMSAMTPGTPKLIHADLNDLGYTMPLMDFGIQFVENSTSSELISSASSMTWPSLGPLQEFYVVFQDKYATVSTGYHPQLIGTTSEGSALNPQCSYPFHRQFDERALMKDWSSASINSGYISMDGVKTACTTQLTDTNLHAYAFVSTVPITNTFAFVRRTNYRIGGAAIGECLAFATSNSVARRKSIEAYLCKKWLNKTVEAPAIPWQLDSVEVEDGATLTLTDATDYGIASLRGTGTVVLSDAVSAITNLSSLATTFTGATSCTKVTVEGAVILPDLGTVTVAVADDFRVKALWYPILEATQLEGDVSHWTVTNPDGRLDRPLKVEKQGNVLGVRVVPNGMVLIFR